MDGICLDPLFLRRVSRVAIHRVLTDRLVASQGFSPLVLMPSETLLIVLLGPVLAAPQNPEYGPFRFFGSSHSAFRE